MTTDNDQPRLYLRFGGVQPESTGVPFLPPFYSYLLKLSPKVGLVDIYPWLAEIIFRSDVVSIGGGSGGRRKQQGVRKPKREDVPNVVAFFIDDQKDNIANAMAEKAPERSNGQYVWDDDFARFCAEIGEKDPEALPRLFVIDTYGQYHDADSLNDRFSHSVGRNAATAPEISSDAAAQVDHPLYVRSALSGTGNPARMLQKFSAVMELKKMPPPLMRPNERNPVPETRDLGPLNCFVFNSITYLTRSVGFREAMNLVRAILEQAVWKPNPGANPGALGERDALFFAVLHEGVHTADQIRYAETFFDGVIAFDSEVNESGRVVTVLFEQFPLTAHENEGDQRFLPDYSSKRVYRPYGGRRLLRHTSGNWTGLEIARSTVNTCSDAGPPLSGREEGC